LRNDRVNRAGRGRKCAKINERNGKEKACKESERKKKICNTKRGSIEKANKKPKKRKQS
jgi:hypothetical protein